MDLEEHQPKEIPKRQELALGSQTKCYSSNLIVTILL